MPAVIPVHVALRSELKESVQHAVKRDVRLEALIACKPSKPGGGFHGKSDFSQPPWYAPVAHSHLDLHSLSRKLEKELRMELRLPKRERGGSSLNTRKALEAVSRHCEGVCDYAVRYSTRELEKWSRRASIALEITEAPRKLPRSEGHPEAACPFCENRTLRILPIEGRSTA